MKVIYASKRNKEASILNSAMNTKLFWCLPYKPHSLQAEFNSVSWKLSLRCMLISSGPRGMVRGSAPSLIRPIGLFTTCLQLKFLQWQDHLLLFKCETSIAFCQLSKFRHIPKCNCLWGTPSPLLAKQFCSTFAKHVIVYAFWTPPIKNSWIRLCLWSLMLKSIQLYLFVVF